jgi:septum site-determining protein MinC
MTERLIATATNVAFELKANLITLVVLRLLDNDLEKIAEQLAKKADQAPQLFRNVPIVIDLKASPQNLPPLELSNLVKLLRDYGLIPVGLRGGDAGQHEAATHLGLGLMPDVKPAKMARPALLPLPLVTKVIKQPVRSGQQVTALEGDLVILSSVSSGAELLAHRHIHIYGALRGRALAGVNGDTDARIFCHHFDAELVAIAGQYQINEEFAEPSRGKPAHIYLKNDTLVIETLEPYPR